MPNSKSSDPVWYYGLEVEYFHLYSESGESDVMDIKVAAFKPYRLCAQPVIIAPNSRLVPDAEGYCDFGINQKFLGVPHKCLQIWGINSIVLPDEESYSIRLHGLAWMLAFAQFAATRWNQAVSAYAVTKHGRAPGIYEGTPQINFGPKAS